MNLLSHSVLAAGLPRPRRAPTRPWSRPTWARAACSTCSGWSSRCPVLGAVLLLGVAPFLPASLKAAADKHGHLLGTAMAALSFVLSLVLFFTLLGRDAESRQVGQHLWTWFETGSLTRRHGPALRPAGRAVPAADHRRRLADPRLRHRLHGARPAPPPLLRLPQPVRRRDAHAGPSANFVGLFLGWEGVGLASYLLIGFWQHKPSAAAAAKKAFVINRVGDIGLSLAIALMFATFGTTDFGAVERAGRRGEPGHAQRARPAAPARRVRQVRAGAAPGVAARRDGGPDPGLGPDPRGDHGHRRRLPRRPVQLHLRPHARSRRPRSSSSPPSRSCGVRSSAAPRTTSRRRWPARR